MESVPTFSDCSAPTAETCTPDFSARKDKRDEKLQWTFAVDLMLNMSAETKNGHLGAEQKQNLLRELAESTKSKPVAFLVQTSPYQSGEMNRSLPLPRLLIKNGEIEELAPGIATGASKGISELVDYAIKTQPAHKLGLVLFSHGFAQLGLDGDRGAVPLDALSSSVHAVLAKNNHGKLDLLAFDSCLMASTATISKAEPISKNVVASAELLPCRDETCGLDLKTWLSAAVQDPEQTGAELASQAISITRAHSDVWKPGRGPATLSHFQLGPESRELNSAINRFGFHLTKSLGTVGNQRMIQNVVDETNQYDRAFMNAMDPSPRDLTDFAHRIATAAHDGRLKDYGHNVERSANEVIGKIEAIRKDFFGTNQNRISAEPYSADRLAFLPENEKKTYSQLGGLSIFLPDKERTFLSKTAHGKMLNQCFEARPIGDERRGASVLAGQFTNLQASVAHSKATDILLASIHKNIEKVSAAASVADAQFNSNAFRAAKNNLCADIMKLGNNRAIKQLDRAAIDAQIPSEHKGWRGFVETLSEQSYRK